MKHVGKMKNNSARVAVVYRTLPGDPTHALVVGTQGLIDSYHDSLMSLIEGDTGQQANELAEILAVRKFPDGGNMLATLHNQGHLKKVPTHMVLMTPAAQTSIPLNELNELIAKQKGVSVEDLAVTDGSGEPQTRPTKTKAPEVIVESKPAENFTLTPAEMRSRADALYKEAARLRKEADQMDPPKKKTKKVSAEAE